MSAKTSRSRVQSVNSAASGQTGAGGAILAAVLVGGAIKLLSAATRAALELSRTALPHDALKTIHPLADLRVTRAQIQTNMRLPETLSSVEATKAKALAALSASGYRITSEAKLEDPLARLCEAGSVAGARKAEQQILTLLESEHQAVMNSALRTSCINAAIRIGFTGIQTMKAPAGMVRLVATNEAGQSLVTEISSDAEGHTIVETEVVGVSDGSCNSILDALDKALEDEGVRSSPPKRTFTGGVCELAAAREFVRNRIRPAQVSDETTTSAADLAGKRAQRLNAPQTVKQR